METRSEKQKNGNGKSRGEGAVVNFQRVEIVRTAVEVVQRKGSPPLLMNRMSDGVIQHLGGRATGEVVAKPEKASVEETAKGHIHFVDGRVAFPARAFGDAVIGACRHQTVNKKLTMARMSGAFSVTGEAEDYCLIESDPYVVRADVVNTSGKNGPPSVTFRPAFPNWSTKLFFDYNPHAIEIAEILHLLDLGGFHVAVGSFRPLFGKFTVK